MVHRPRHHDGCIIGGSGQEVNQTTPKSRPAMFLTLLGSFYSRLKARQAISNAANSRNCASNGFPTRWRQRTVREIASRNGGEKLAKVYGITIRWPARKFASHQLVQECRCQSQSQVIKLMDAGGGVSRFWHSPFATETIYACIICVWCVMHFQCDDVTTMLE